MNPERNARLAVVEPLDEESRRFVPRSTGALLEERTAREQDLPSTEPDGAGNEALARVRDSVVSGLLQLEDQRNKTPRDARAPEPVAQILGEDKPTQPARLGSSPSDVFAPLGARERVIDSEGATPRDRPLRIVGQDKPTDLDVQRAAPTLTMQGRPPLRSEPTEPLIHSRYERERDHERKLVMSIYDSERTHHDLENVNPQRAADIRSLATHLKATGELDDRDLVLAAHAREKIASKRAAPELKEGHEDRVIALALVGRELDDRYRDQMSVHKEKLLDELEVLPQEKRDQVFADFESFAERDAANDSNFCRREMHKALREEREELHRAYVFALALKKKPVRVEENVPTVVGDENDSGARRKR